MTNRISPPAPSLARNNIGGAIVCRGFSLSDGAHARPGTTLSEALVRAMKNRMALESAGYIKIFAKNPIQAAPPEGDAKRYIVHCGQGRYDVIEGTRLNTEFLSKEEALELTKGFEPPAREPAN
jgi:hypothetical protein